MKQFVKIILNKIWSLKKPKFENRVIYYHSVADNLERAHTKVSFAKQMDWLKNNGITGTSVSKLISETEKGVKDTIGISFDDGYADNCDVASRILLDRGFTATIFIATNYCSKYQRTASSEGYRLYPGRNMLNHSDLKYLSSKGFEIGSHGMSHHMMTRMSFASALKEIQESKKKLEDLLGEEVTSFAFPNGQAGAFSENLVEACKLAGYKIVCTTIWGSINKNMKTSYIPRCEMSHKDTLDDFSNKIIGYRDYRTYVDNFIDKSKYWNDIKT